MSVDLSRFDHMTVEELAAVLRADLESGEEGQLNDETLLYVLQLYANLTDKPPKSAKEAYAAFLRDYLPGGKTEYTKEP